MPPSTKHNLFKFRQENIDFRLFDVEFGEIELSGLGGCLDVRWWLNAPTAVYLVDSGISKYVGVTKFCQCIHLKL